MSTEKLTLEEAQQLAALKHDTATVFMRQVHDLHAQIYAYRNKLTQMAISLESVPDDNEVIGKVKADISELLAIPTSLKASGFPASQPPERKNGWDHSDQVLVYYEEAEGHQAAWGLAYYHYEPPFGSEPEWVDFRRGGKVQPAFWWPMPPISDLLNPFFKDTVTSLEEAKDWFLSHTGGRVNCERKIGEAQVQCSVSSYPDAKRFFERKP